MKLKFLPFIVLVLSFSTSVCKAQFGTELPSPKPVMGEFFGRSVAIHGDFMFVGATRAFGNTYYTKSSETGVVYVYKKNGSGWKFHQKIDAFEQYVSGEFGFSIDVSQDHAIIGAPNAGSSGAAYIYKREGDQWVKQLRLPEEYSSHYGYSVAISENYAIVGAIQSKGNGPSWRQRGSAWIYAKVVIDNTETWTQVAHLTASDELDYAHFGYKVDINDNTAVVSAYTGVAGEVYERSGVYVFERTDDAWRQVSKLQPHDARNEERELFGWDINLFNNQLIVGAPKDSIREGVSGSAYIFEKEGGSWVEKAKLVTSDENIESFGRAVEIRDNLAIIGASAKIDASENEQGTAYAFLKTEEGWRQVKELSVPRNHYNGSISYGYSESIAISETDIVVGHYDSSKEEDMAGIAIVYDKSYLQLARPTGLKVSVGNGSVLLHWQDNSINETSFIIERSIDEEFETKESFTSSANTTSYEDLSVQEEVTYFYRVKADNSIIHSEPSNTERVFTGPTGVNDTEENQLRIFPNPVTDYIAFRFDESLINSNNTSIEIRSLSGRLVFDKSCSFTALRSGIKLPAHLSGMYILSIEFSGKILKRKLVINPRR